MSSLPERRSRRLSRTWRSSAPVLSSSFPHPSHDSRDEGVDGDDGVGRSQSVVEEEGGHHALSDAPASDPADVFAFEDDDLLPRNRTRETPSHRVRCSPGATSDATTSATDPEAPSIASYHQEDSELSNTSGLQDARAFLPSLNTASIISPSPSPSPLPRHLTVLSPTERAESNNRDDQGRNGGHYIGNPLIRIVVKAVAGFLFICFLPRLLTHLRHDPLPNSGVFYEPLALYDDFMAMAESYTTTHLELLQSGSIDLFSGLSLDSATLCSALFEYGDTWNPHRIGRGMYRTGSILPSGPSSTQDAFDGSRDDESAWPNEKRDEQGIVNLHDYCDALSQDINQATTLFEDVSSLGWIDDVLKHFIDLLDDVGEDAGLLRPPLEEWDVTMQREKDRIAAIRARDYSSNVDLSLRTWPAHPNQTTAVRDLHRCLTHSRSLTNSSSKSTRIPALHALRDKLGHIRDSLDQLVYMVGKVVIHSSGGHVSWFQAMLYTNEEMTESNKLQSLIEAAAQIDNCRPNISDYLDHLDLAISRFNTIIACEAALVEFTAELLAASSSTDILSAFRVKSPRYRWAGTGWKTQRPRDQRQLGNSSRSIEQCDCLPERYRNMPGRSSQSTLDRKADSSAESGTESRQDTIILFVPDPVRMAPLLNQSCWNITALRSTLTDREDLWLKLNLRWCGVRVVPT